VAILRYRVTTSHKRPQFHRLRRAILPQNWLGPAQNRTATEAFPWSRTKTSEDRRTAAKRPPANRMTCQSRRKARESISARAPVEQQQRFRPSCRNHPQEVPSSALGARRGPVHSQANPEDRVRCGVRSVRRRAGSAVVPVVGRSGTCGDLRHLCEALGDRWRP
jgi:hypothetical protein